MDKNKTVRWYAMSAIYRSELKVKDYLDSRGIECYVPMTEVVRLRRGRKVKEKVPAVCNLIFVHSDSQTINNVKTVQPRLQFKTMPCEGKNERIVIPDEQMAEFIQVSSSSILEKEYVDPALLKLRAGQRVKVTLTDGTSIEGIFMTLKKKKTIVVNAGSVIAIAFDGDGKTIEVLGENS